MMAPNFRLPKGLRGRFLLAFGGVGAVAGLCAAAGLAAWLRTGDAPGDDGARRLSEAAGAVTLAAQAARLVAVGPALLNAAGPDEISRLNEGSKAALAAARRQLSAMRDTAAGDVGSATALGDALTRLDHNLDAVAAAVRRRNAAVSETQALLHKMLDALQQAATISEAESRAFEEQQAEFRRHRAERPPFVPTPLDRLQEGFARVFSLLAAAAETGDADRLAELETAAAAELRGVDALSSRLGAPSSAPLAPALGLLHRSALGPEGLFAARKRALDASADGRRRLDETVDLGKSLADAVGAAIDVSGQQLTAAAGRTLATRRLVSLLPAVIAPACLLGAVLIAWFYVGRDVVSRLTRLGAAIQPNASGPGRVTVTDRSGDAIEAIGRAVEAMRRDGAARDPPPVARPVTAGRFNPPVARADRTAQSADEAALLHVVFDALHQGVAIFDRNLNLEVWNRPFRDLLKLPDPFLEGRPSFDDFYRLLGRRGEFGPGDLEKKLAITRSAIDRPLLDERTRADGTTLEIRRNPISGGGFVVIYADITERKQAEAQARRARQETEASLAELKAMRAKLIDAERMAALGRRAVELAEDIKGPLNFVANFATISVDMFGELRATTGPVLAALPADQRLRAEAAVANLSGNLERIALQSKRAEGSVQGLLAHAPIGRGEWQSVDINALVEEALGIAYYDVRARDHGLNITLERDLDPTIEPIAAVPHDLSRGLVNLFKTGLHAATATRRGSTVRQLRPVLKVTTRERFGDVVILARDNGAGIAPAQRDRLFHPTATGSGGDLSISHDIIVKQHGGSIGVDSRPGDFTEFTVRLPRERPAAARGTAA